MSEAERQRTRSTAQAAAEGLRVFVAGVAWKVTEDVLRKDFEECGVVEDLFLIKDKEGNSRGKCIITFRDQDAVKAALKYDNTEYAGRTIYVKVADAKPDANPGGEKKEGQRRRDVTEKPAPVAKEKAFPMEKPDGCVSLCLKGIGDAVEEDIRKLLKGCTIQSVRVVRDRATGTPRGIAFVDFTDTEEVDKAMLKNGRGVKGNVVEMYYEAPRVRPRPEGCLSVAVKKLPAEATDDNVKELFKGLESITDVRLIRNKQQECTGLAFVEFSDGADVEKAVKRDGMAVQGQTVFVCYETKGKKATNENDTGAGGSAKGKGKGKGKGKENGKGKGKGDRKRTFEENSKEDAEANVEEQEPKPKKKKSRDADGGPNTAADGEEEQAETDANDQVAKGPKKKKKIKHSESDVVEQFVAEDNPTAATTETGADTSEAGEGKKKKRKKAAPTQESDAAVTEKETGPSKRALRAKGKKRIAREAKEA